MKTIAVYPGTFDPITHGHVELIRRASSIFPEVVVLVSGSPKKSPFFGVEERVRMVREAVIDRFDHKHLNLDCEEFAALNPSVENIARVIWGLIEKRCDSARLCSVRVWETAKTHAEYTGP